MNGAMVAAVGPAINPAEVAARLQRLRLSASQQTRIEARAGFCIGVLSDPLRTAPDPFRPLARAADDRYVGLLQGRIDNLTELPGGRELGASRWAVEQWARGGVEALAPLVGSFVVLIADLSERRLSVVRDPLGDRSVCYARAGEVWWVASEEPALWPAGSGALQLDGRRVAEYFAIEYPAPDRTFFAGISELPPAHWLALASNQPPRVSRHWRFRYRREVRKLSLDEAGEALAALLGRAVDSRIEHGGTSAIAVSGGMDSPAIAALAPPSAGARLYSYHPEAFPQCDESALAQTVAAHLEMPFTAVRCDRHWPLGARFFEPRWLPHEPSVDAYRALRFELARAAAGDGCRVLLTGDFGDHIYAGFRYWLKDLFAAGQRTRALKHVARRLLRHGLIGLRRDPPLRRIMPLVGVTRGRARARAWLTGPANELLGAGDRDHAYLGRIDEVDRIEGCLNNFGARAAHLGYLQGLRWGLDIRTPFRDRRLVEFALSLPGHYLYDPERDLGKAVMRHALRGRLPAPILERRDKTSFEPLFRHGVFRAERAQVDALLEENRHWGTFVRRDWLRTRLERGNWDDPSLSVLWNCIAFSLWCRQVERPISIDTRPANG